MVIQCYSVANYSDDIHGSLKLFNEILKDINWFCVSMNHFNGSVEMYQITSNPNIIFVDSSWGNVFKTKYVQLLCLLYI